MSRLIIYLWFPHLAAERTRRAGLLPGAQPLVLTAKYHGADIVESLCKRAKRQGLRIAMRLADARALCPELASLDADPAADRHDLYRLALWARRYSPLTAPDYAGQDTGDGAAGVARGGNTALTAFAGDGIWLDVAGADHLHGGIRPLLADMLRRLRKAGLTVRHAVAPTCGAAWALARYGRRGHTLLSSTAGKAVQTALAGLPLAALRLDSALCTAMHTAGLRYIGDIFGMPRAPLAARFGTILVERLDAAFGHINESFAPIAPPRPLVTVQNFAEPVAAPDDIKAVIRRLTQDIAGVLEAEAMAARRLRLGWQLLDGGIGVKDVHLSRPSRDIVAFHRLLAEASEAINPEFGIESAWMEAHGCILQTPVAMGFEDGIIPAQRYADLVDRLVAKLGYGAVLHMKSRACWQPEAAQYMALPDVESPGFVDPANQSVTGCADDVSSDALDDTKAPRPIRLLAHPHPLSVTALLPDHPPAQFVWQKQHHKIIRATGPERIAPQWWVASSGTRTRDYFRLQDDRGARFWVYREGLPERGEDTSWFLHGFFA